MSTIAMWIKKCLIVAVAAAVGLSALPIVSVQAEAANPPATPAPGQSANNRLQTAWEKEQTIYARIGKVLDRAGGLISRIQTRLDRAKSQGKDVVSIQTALDAFSAAIKNVQPIYTEMQAIVQSHSGFDALGNVTDPTQARQTVWDMRSKLQEIRQIGVREAGKALREAIQAFRQSNQTTTPTPSSTTG